MDEKLQLAIGEVDPHVAFRAIQSHAHHTWAKTFHCRPEHYLKPQSLEEIQKIVKVARRCKRRVVTVGCGHSPSDLTMTSSWVVNLDDYNKILNVDKDTRRMRFQGGVRLHALNLEAKKHGLTIPNLGSIDEQSLIGAFSTATHGSSLKHGLISENVKSFTIVLSDGNAVKCSVEENEELFRAGLVSLGALGVIAEVEYEMTTASNIEWTQTLEPLDYVLSRWNDDLWTNKEFTRVWWVPYMKRSIIWSATRTDKPEKEPESNWYGGSVGFHTYHILLWLSNRIPRILPWVEWFVFGMQYGFSDNMVTGAVEEQRTGLLMNCLYSQFVNEWAIPLEKGPEAITRLSAWFNREEGHDIPFDNRGLYVHAPIEVRVSDTSRKQPRPLLDNSNLQGPTLYLNATLYRPYLQDPPCKDRYYEAFEWLMRQMGGKPHWAKNFAFTDSSYISEAFGENLEHYLRVRDEVDPDGMFIGAWHRRNLLAPNKPMYACEEAELARSKASDGGMNWVGEMNGRPRPEEDRDALLNSDIEVDSTAHGPHKHGRPRESFAGTRVFDKM